MITQTKGVIVFVVRRHPIGSEVLFLRRSGGRHVSQWWPVGGTCKEGETPVFTAIREINEETGLSPNVMYNFVEDIRHADEQSYIKTFVAFVKHADSVSLNWEHSEYKWLHHQEALAIGA